MPGHDGIHRFWFKKFHSICDRLAFELNSCLEKNKYIQIDDKGNNPLIKKTPKKKLPPATIDR